MRITATAFLAFTAVASAKSSTAKVEGTRKLQDNNNNNGNYNNGNANGQNQNQNQNQGQGNGDNGYWDNNEYSGYYNNNGNSGNINDYMSNLKYYENARDQKSQYGYYGQQAREYDEEVQDWQQSMQGQRAWGSANYGQASSSASDTRWMGDYSIKFEGCATDFDSSRYGQSKTELLARFKLCPSGSSKCRNGGEYVVPMSEYVMAFENLVMTDENCAAQQEICYNQCLNQARYGDAYNAEANNNGGNGGRRLANNNNRNNNKNNNQDEDSAYNQAKQQYYQYHNYNADKNSEWQEQQQEKQQQYQDEYGYNDEQSEQYKQARANYYGNIEYSSYNGGNYATAYHNGQYDANANAQTDDFDYEEYRNYVEQQTNGDSNNYYNRDNNSWRDVNNYFDEEYCRYDCMADAGMGYCTENAEENGANGYNDMNAPAMVDCQELDYYSTESQPLWVGATCRDGGVYLDTFTDSACTKVAPSGTHETAVGYSLPDQNLVNEDTLSCSGTLTYMHNQYFENWDQMNEYAQSQQQQAISICEALYTNSGKCEANMKISEKNTQGCNYIHRMSGVNRFSRWIYYGIGLVVAACLLVAAYIGYSKAKTNELHITVKTIQSSARNIQSSVEGSIDQMSHSVNAMIQQAGKALKEPLAPKSDDATVTSAESAPSAQYQAATIPETATQEQPPKDAAVV